MHGKVGGGHTMGTLVGGRPQWSPENTDPGRGYRWVPGTHGMWVEDGSVGTIVQDLAKNYDITMFGPLHPPLHDEHWGRV